VKRPVAAAGALVFIVLGAGSAAAREPAGARAEVERLITASGAEVAVAFRTLGGKDQLLIGPDVPYHAASTMKVPVMIELFAQAKKGMLRLDDPLPVKNSFASIVDGSPYSLDPGDDSDPEIYKSVGGTLSLRRLCEAMITVSSNLAANLLIEKLGVANIRKRIHALRADGMDLRRGVEDGKAFQKGLNNTTTARALMVLLDRIARGRAVDAASDREMVLILARQRFRDAIPAGLPPGTPVAHKTGSITKIHHDAAIVYAPRPFVLVVLVRGLQDEKQSAALIAAIARVLYAVASGPGPVRADLLGALAAPGQREIADEVRAHAIGRDHEVGRHHRGGPGQQGVRRHERAAVTAGRVVGQGLEDAAQSRHDRRGRVGPVQEDDRAVLEVVDPVGPGDGARVLLVTRPHGVVRT